MPIAIILALAGNTAAAIAADGNYCEQAANRILDHTKGGVGRMGSFDSPKGNKTKIAEGYALYKGSEKAIVTPERKGKSTITYSNTNLDGRRFTYDFTLNPRCEITEIKGITRNKLRPYAVNPEVCAISSTVIPGKINPGTVEDDLAKLRKKKKEIEAKGGTVPAEDTEIVPFLCFQFQDQFAKTNTPSHPSGSGKSSSAKSGKTAN